MLIGVRFRANTTIYRQKVRFCATAQGNYENPFAGKPSSWWACIDNQREYWKWFRQKNNMPAYADLYKVTKPLVLKFGGEPLLRKYNYSPVSAITSAYPDHDWKEWEFVATPRNWWRSISNQRIFLESLRKHLGYESLEHMYNLHSKDVIEYGGATLLKLYSESVALAVLSVYPEHHWKLWKFRRIPKDWWANMQNQLLFLDSVKEELQLREMSDWYKVSNSTLYKLGGRGLLRYYNNSVSAMLRNCYPDHEWQLWRFTVIPKDEWNDLTVQRQFCEWVTKELNLSSLNDWYSVAAKNIADLGGFTLLATYGSLYKMLKNVFPHHPWKQWEFKYDTENAWVTENARTGLTPLRQLILAIGKQFGVAPSDLNDWYRVSEFKLPVRIRNRLTLYGGLPGALRQLYPNHAWDPARFVSRQKRTEQQITKRIMHELFPGKSTEFQVAGESP